MRFRFQSNQRLKHARAISFVLENGKKFHHYPLLFISTVLPPHTPQGKNSDPEARNPASPMQIAFSVPKRRIKKAVNRNRIKRQMREAFRLQQHFIRQPLSVPSHTTIWVVVIFIGQEMPGFEDIFTAMQQFLKRL